MPRSAARCAGELAAAGALLLAFPLHPPGKPEKSRSHELDALLATGTPTVIVQGQRDTFGTPEEVAAVCAADLVVIPDADHGMKVPKRAALSIEEARGLIVESALEWIVREVVG